MLVWVKNNFGFFLPVACFALQSFARGQTQIDDLSPGYVQIFRNPPIIERQLIPELRQLFGGHVHGGSDLAQAGDL
jgi:hypothetical protein